MDAMEKWDRTASYLQAMQYQANMASHHIDELRNILEMINEKPPFLTLSQDAIDQLGRKLTAMQLSYAHIQEKLSAIPVTA